MGIQFKKSYFHVLLGLLFLSFLLLSYQGVHWLSGNINRPTVSYNHDNGGLTQGNYVIYILKVGNGCYKNDE